MLERAVVRPGKESGIAMRRRLVELVEGQPGVFVAEAARQLGTSTATITYHTRVLQRRGSLVVVQEGRANHLFLNGSATPCSRRLLPLLQAACVRDAAAALIERGAVDITDLRALGWSRGAAAHALRTLAIEGFARRQRGRVVRDDARAPCLERALRGVTCRCASAAHAAMAVPALLA